MIAKICGIYKILNIITRDYYLGSSCNILVRWIQHRHDLRKNLRKNEHLQNAWNKYGEQAFEFSVVLLCDIEHKLYLEDGLIKLLNPAYNIAKDALAPMQGRHPSDETRRKTSESTKGKNKGELNHMFGKQHGAEARAKMSAANTGERNPSFGKHPSDETRAQMSEAHKGERNPKFGTHPSEKSRARMSEAQKGNTNALGHKRTEETRAKTSVAMKRAWALKREAQTA